MDAAGFSKFVRGLMDSRGWDIGEIADKVGVHRNTVSKHLNAVDMPHRSTRKLYAQAFGIDVDKFEAMYRAPIAESASAPSSEGPVQSHENRGLHAPRFALRDIQAIVDAIAEMPVEDLREIANAIDRRRSADLVDPGETPHTAGATVTRHRRQKAQDDDASVQRPRAGQRETRAPST